MNPVTAHENMNQESTSQMQSSSPQSMDESIDHAQDELASASMSMSETTFSMPTKESKYWRQEGARDMNNDWLPSLNCF